LSNRTFVIAEAGVNHNGSLERALRLIDVAAAAGADAVKFQTFDAASLVTASAGKARYQVTNTGDSGPQLGMLRSLEISRRDHHELVKRCRANDIQFLSTAFDTGSLAFLSELEVSAIKIPSGDITCAPLLLQAARMRRPMIVSTGMSTLGEIEQALGVIAFGLTDPREPAGSADFSAAYCSEIGREALREHVTLLHCVTEYPAPPASVNLRAIDTMASAFGLPVGYSDHTLGIEVAIAAVARGAVLIEKHFTLDRSLPGPDHAASLLPDELEQLVACIRNVEVALGSPRKLPAPAETANREIARRSLVAAKAIKFGQVFTVNSLAYKRPGQGVSPMALWDFVGRSAGRDYEADDLIEP
jgi:N-acetylneuraminate synthase